MSLRGQLLRVVLATLVPTVILAVVLTVVLVQRERDARRDALLDVARAISGAVDSEISRSISALQVLALSDSLTTDDFATFRDRARVVRDLQTNWVNIAVTSSTGDLLLSLRTPPGEALPALRNVREIVEAAERRTPVVSSVLTSTLTGRPFMSISVPVIREGAVKYVLVAIIDAESWTPWLAARTPQGWIAALDDRDGVIAGRSAEPERFVGKRASDPTRSLYEKAGEGAGEVVNILGDRVLTSFHTSPFTGMRTLVLVPAIQVEAPAMRLRALLVAGMLGVAMLAVTFALWASRPTTRGMARLSTAIGKIAEGERVETGATGVSDIDDAALAVARAADLVRERSARVDTLQKQLAERAEAAENANAAKDRFLAMLGHELRNPLAAISNAGLVLARRPGGPEAERMVDVVNRQSRHLAALVDDLLDISRLAANKLTLHRALIDLRSVVAGVMEVMSRSGRFAAHEVRIDTVSAVVEGDPDRLAQVIRNLLDNALKFTPARGRIDVTVAVEEGRATLTVADSGVGLDAAELRRIFEPFEQGAQGMERSSGGLGLGLAIARQIVTLHEGTIEAESEGPGRGTRVRVSLPLAADAGTVADEGFTVRRTVLPSSVLVVEDHEDSRVTLAAMLKGEGHRVLEACDGKAGLERLLADRPDIAFVDLGLPGVDGFEIARRARAQRLATRLVALTGYGQPADRERALAAGFDAFLVKPATLDVLRATLSAV